MKFYDTLPHATKEKLFDVMRSIDRKIEYLDKQAQELYPPHGQIAVGAAFFDPFLKAEYLRAYLHGLREGHTPKESLFMARVAGRKTVIDHNSKRKDINWKREVPTDIPSHLLFTHLSAMDVLRILDNPNSPESSKQIV